MTQLWRALLNRLAPSRTVDGLLRTYAPSAPDDGATRPGVFDPALLPSPSPSSSALRAGDPVIANEGVRRRWSELRRRATDLVLRRIAESTWGDALILRGSRMLSAWLGDAAREPGDLDWVVDPPALRPADPQVARLQEDLIEAVSWTPWPAEVEFLTDRVASSDIWNYERAPGRRLVFPWRAAGLPGGVVQVDVVFGESLAEPARQETLRTADGGCVCVRAASPAQSLAWKLSWLAWDIYPQGKDLFDATLLAERFPLPPAVLDETVRLGGSPPLTGSAAQFLQGEHVDWANFRAEYPRVDGDVKDWLRRLRTAIEPTFAARDGAEFPVRPVAVAPDAPWRTPNVVAIAEGIDAARAYGRLPILADAMEDAGCDDADLLSHCRANGPHSGGCRVVDVLLKK